MMLTEKRFTKAISLLIVLVTIISIFALPVTASAASNVAAKRVTNVRAYNKVTYIGSTGDWKCYSHSANIRWNAVSGADYYEVRYRNGSWTQVTKTVYGTTYKFPGYNCHGFGATWTMPYYYQVQVRAVDVNGSSVTYGKWSYAKTVWC